MNLQVGEPKRAHVLSRRIALSIVRQHLGVSLGNRSSDESCGLGFVVALHEPRNVAVIPGGHLIIQHVSDILLGRRSQKWQRDQHPEESGHRDECTNSERIWLAEVQYCQVTDLQLYLAIGIPTFAVLVGILMNAVQYSGLNARFNGVDSRFASVDSRLSSVETRISNLETRMDARFNNLEVKFDTLTGKVVDINNRVTRIVAKLGIS
jgi:hypothetical protein